MEDRLIDVRTFSDWYRVATGTAMDTEHLEEVWEWRRQFEEELKTIFASKERWRKRAVGVAPGELVRLWDKIEDEERKAAAELDELRMSRRAEEN